MPLFNGNDRRQLDYIGSSSIQKKEKKEEDGVGNYVEEGGGEAEIERHIFFPISYFFLWMQILAICCIYINRFPIFYGQPSLPPSTHWLMDDTIML